MRKVLGIARALKIAKSLRALYLPLDSTTLQHYIAEAHMELSMYVTRFFLDSDEIIYLKSNHLSLTQARNRDMFGNLFIENRFYLYLQQPKLVGHIFTGLLLHSRIETYLSSKLFFFRKESHKNLAPYLLTKMIALGTS